MSKLFKSYTFNIILISLVAVFVLWLTLQGDYKAVIEVFSKIEMRWIFIIFIAVAIIHIIEGFILTKLTKLSNPHYTAKDGIICALIAAFVSGITPSSTGGQVAQIYAFRKQGVRVSDSASIIWMDFIIFQSILCLLVLVLFLLKFTYFFMNYSQLFVVALLGYILNLIVIFGLWAIAKFPKIYTWITTTGINIGTKLKIVKDPQKSRDNLNAQLEKFKFELQRLANHKKLILECSIMQTLRLLLMFIIPLLCYVALGFKLQPGFILDTLALSSFVLMINAFIPIPGASGGTEFTYVLMFTTIFGGLAAKSTMLIWRFMTFYLVLIIGALALLYVKLGYDKVRY